MSLLQLKIKYSTAHYTHLQILLIRLNLSAYHGISSENNTDEICLDFSDRQNLQLSVLLNKLQSIQYAMVPS